MASLQIWIVRIFNKMMRKNSLISTDLINDRVISFFHLRLSSQLPISPRVFSCYRKIFCALSEWNMVGMSEIPFLSEISLLYLLVQ